MPPGFRGFTGYGSKKPVNQPSAPKAPVQFSNTPMGAGMSMAMAGNTGLAGLSEAQANQIKQGQMAVNQFLGNTSQPVSFKTIGQQFDEHGSKYRRPADKLRYADKMRLLNEGIAGGGKFFVGPDGIPRFSFMGMENKPMDASGQKFLSMMLPEITATPPTLGQLGGDISRAFTDYDTLKYPSQNFQGPFPPGPSADMAFMQSQPGMFSGINALSLIPGVGTAMNIAKGAKSVFDFMFPKKPKVTYGSETDISVTEGPMNTGIGSFDRSETLTEFGKLLADRVRNDQPGISETELYNRLKRMNDAGFAAQGRPVFTTGMFAQGGVASLQ